MTERNETEATPEPVELTNPLIEKNPAGLEGAAGFADSESREILNLIATEDSGEGCCGGGVCRA